jgi:Tfp pilus assembly protein PilO
VAALAQALGKRKLPLSVTVESGKVRTAEQNRLQWKWAKEAAEQLKDETTEEKRAYCKLHFGIPILRADSDDYREAYDRLIRPLPYEAKLEMMMAPIDYPVTRLMTTKQKALYLDRMYQHFREQGVMLTEPEGETWA